MLHDCTHKLPEGKFLCYHCNIVDFPAMLYGPVEENMRQSRGENCAHCGTPLWECPKAISGHATKAEAHAALATLAVIGA